MAAPDHPLRPGFPGDPPVVTTATARPSEKKTPARGRCRFHSWLNPPQRRFLRT